MRFANIDRDFTSLSFKKNIFSQNFYDRRISINNDKSIQFQISKLYILNLFLKNDLKKYKEILL